jgi:MOSC domain-containing protein YiiM
MKGMNEESPLAHLMDHFSHGGKVTWIGLRPGREVPVRLVNEAEVLPGKGLVGDRFKGNEQSTRQVTFIQAEHIDAVASMMKVETLDPSLLRRNIVVEGINLLALKDKPFKIGSAVFEMTGLCHPCSKMEAALGFGGYNAMRGHGGITARVIKAGHLQVGDSVEALSGGSFSS